MNDTTVIPTAFEALTPGKGRLYPISKEKRIAEWERIKEYKWATHDHVAKYEGYLKINAAVIEELQAALKSQGEVFRYNLKVCELLDEEKNIKQFNIDYWIPSRPPAKAEPAASNDDDIFDDNIPF